MTTVREGALDALDALAARGGGLPRTDNRRGGDAVKWTDEGEWVPTLPGRRQEIIGALIVAAVPWIVAVALIIHWR